MKWLLVTTNPTPNVPGSAHPGGGWNVGDQFARVGVEQLVREVDPGAVIELLNVDRAEDLLTERPFDRAIFAGRPMFWRSAELSPLWVHLLNGWLCRDPRKVLALGVGDCFPLGDRAFELGWQLTAAAARVWRLLLRAQRSVHLKADGVEVSVCPGAWALLDRPEAPVDRLCNFMRGGGHYPEYEMAEVALWQRRAAEFARALRSEGFLFIAHTLPEATLAEQLGWKPSEIRIGWTVDDYLRIYARAARYVGNRMHGAIVLAGRRATTTAIGFDSRNAAARAALALVFKPSDLLPSMGDFIARRSPGVLEEDRIDRIRVIRARALAVVREFAS